MPKSTATISNCYHYYLSFLNEFDSPENTVVHNILSFSAIKKVHTDFDHFDPNTLFKNPKFMQLCVEIQKKEILFLKAIDSIQFSFNTEDHARYHFTQTYNSLFNLYQKLKKQINSYDHIYQNDPMIYLNVLIFTPFLKSLKKIIDHINRNHQQFLIKEFTHKSTTLIDSPQVYYNDSKVEIVTLVRKFKSFPLRDFESKYENLKLAFNLLIDDLAVEANRNSESDLHTFINVFSGKYISDSVIWRGANQVLTEFIKKLTDKKINICYMYKGKWDIALNCFIKPDRTKFAYSQLAHANYNPKNLGYIHDIVKLLY